ncbi:MAG TPA: nucleotidyltransferase family protein [Dehalococcoidia bacterium]|nr:nucleotidyltransferase family protein [Dehalococcoidia bacterium]
MKSLILASGFGTRLSPLTTRAKALLEYKNKPLISHIVSKIPQDVDILVNTNKRFEADFRRWQATLGRAVTLCVEPVFTAEQALGAVGSLHYWVEAKGIAEDLLTIAGDNYFEFDLCQLISAYDGKNTLVAVHDLGDPSRASQFGVVKLEGSRITEFEEKPTRPKSSLIAIACYIFPPRVFPVLSMYCKQGERDNLGSFISYLIHQEEVHAYTFTGLWFDIGSIDVYRWVQQTGW